MAPEPVLVTKKLMPMAAAAHAVGRGAAVGAAAAGLDLGAAVGDLLGGVPHRGVAERAGLGRVVRVVHTAVGHHLPISAALASLRNSTTAASGVSVRPITPSTIFGLNTWVRMVVHGGGSLGGSFGGVGAAALDEIERLGRLPGERRLERRQHLAC